MITQDAAGGGNPRPCSCHVAMRRRGRLWVVFGKIAGEQVHKRFATAGEAGDWTADALREAHPPRAISTCRPD